MKKRKLALYTDISGNEIAINLYEYGNSNKNGVYIQGGIHGGELTYPIFLALHQWLKAHESELTHTILLAPIINPPAWNQRLYYYTAGKFDLYKGKDWNRSYGNNESNTLSEKMSQKILEVARSYELVIDLHTARISKPYVIVTDKLLLPLVYKTGLEYNYFIDMTKGDNAKYIGTLNYAMMQIKKKCLTYECGSHDAWERDSISEVVASLLRHIQPSHEKSGVSRKIFNKVNTIFAPSSGYVKWLTHPRQYVKTGDILLELYPSNDIKKRITIVSKTEGMILELAKTHICWEGDELIRIVPSKAFV